MIPSRIKKGDGPNRRRWPRLNPGNLPFLKSVEFNQGKEIQIINISRGGLLLETEARLRPDMNIMLKLVTTEGILKMEGTILRSSIYSLKGVPKYRSAIAFLNPFEMLDDVNIEEEDQSERISTGVTAEHDDSVESHPAGRIPENEESPAILTVIASDASGVYLKESFHLNEW